MLFHRRADTNIAVMKFLLLKKGGERSMKSFSVASRMQAILNSPDNRTRLRADFTSPHRIQPGG